jgi:hypothetical protein
MTISPGEEAEARGREPSENRLSYLAEVPAPSMTCAHRPGSATLQTHKPKRGDRRLRTGDGVYFTKFGARKLAHYEGMKFVAENY